MNGITVAFPGPEDTILHGWLYTPEGKGPFPTIVYNHGSEKEPTHTHDLPTFFTSHGFAFFKPVRRGHGISSEFNGVKYDYIGDEEDECKKHGSLQEQQACKTHLHEKYNHDVVKAVEWIKGNGPLAYYDVEIDKTRIVVTGGSYGGIQTLLTAEKGKQLGIQACVAFAPCAESWHNAVLHKRLIDAVHKAEVPIFVIQAANDHSICPYLVFGRILKNKGGLNRAELYGKYGETADEGHVLGARTGGTAIWGKDVIDFITTAIRNHPDISFDSDKANKCLNNDD